MALTTIACYVSGHGLGHASRTIETLDAIGARRPDVRLVVRTTAARWIFEQSARVRIEVQTCEADVGMVQHDSLRIDEATSARRAAAFYASFDDRAAREADWLRAERAALVLGDIPPLAFAAAARAGLPSIALGNFTWDWIYADYQAFRDEAPAVVPRVAEAYGLATEALRLPFHGGFGPMEGRITDIPLIARRSRRDPADTRRALGIPAGRPAVLASFGAYGAALPCARAVADGRITVVATDRDTSLPPGVASPPGLIAIDAAGLHHRGLRYEDVVAACDVVLTKPGYGIVSECAANGIPLLYTRRGPFLEEDVLIAEMPHIIRTRPLARADLLEGRWAGAVEALLAQPPPPERARVDGAGVAAEKILGKLATTR